MPISIQQLQQIAQVIYPEGMLRESKVLMGGISAQTILLEIVLSDDGVQRVVLRQHGESDRKFNPNIAQDEYQLLRQLHSIGLPVPKPIYIDLSNTILDIPYMIIEYIEHDNIAFDVLSSEQIYDLSEVLASIHQLDLTQHDLSFLPDQMDMLKARLQQTPTNENEFLHEALLKHLPHLKLNSPAFLHGDYWLGNVLWRDDKIVAVIDWEDALIGDPVSDLGKSRLEILWALGEGAMNIYTDAYFSLMPQVDRAGLPFWDLWGALHLADFADWFDDPDKVKLMQLQYDEFVKVAIQQLST